MRAGVRLVRARFSTLPVKEEGSEKKNATVRFSCFFFFSFSSAVLLSQLVSLPPQHTLRAASVLTVYSQNNRNAHYGSHSSTCLYLSLGAVLHCELVFINTWQGTLY